MELVEPRDARPDDDRVELHGEKIFIFLSPARGRESERRNN
jgi:hypothetical protein